VLRCRAARMSLPQTAPRRLRTGVAGPHRAFRAAAPRNDGNQMPAPEPITAGCSWS
jgi:hypothetical protein